MRRLLPVALLALTTASAVAAALTAGEERAVWNRAEAEWREGPVRYLLTDEESREYRGLAARSERVAFIQRFWASRDPDPLTPGNEAEEIFWQRVSVADRLFSATTTSGWRTDRGRVFILLGPPDEINNYPVPGLSDLDPTRPYDGIKRGAQGDLQLGHRGAVEWIYRSLPHHQADPSQLVTFVRDETGEYILSRRLNAVFRLERPFRSPSTPSPPAAGGRAGGPDPAADVVALANQFDQAMRSVEDAFGFGRLSMFEKAEPPRAPGVRVSSAQFFGVIVVRQRFDFFRGEGGTSTLITVGIPERDASGEKQAASLEVFGRIENVNDPSHAYQFSTLKTSADPAPRQAVADQDHRLYQVRGLLSPGDYRVNLGARVGDRIGTVGDRVTVPAFDGENLSLAGPVLAEDVSDRPLGGGRDAFSLGQIRLVPKLEAVYRTGADFGFYFQAYHAQPGATDGRLHLDINYLISSRQEGVFRLLGKPVNILDSPAPAHGYTFPLRGWTPGEYLLTVTVSDRVSGQVQAGSSAFRVE